MIRKNLINGNPFVKSQIPHILRYCYQCPSDPKIARSSHSNWKALTFASSQRDVPLLRTPIEILDLDKLMSSTCKDLVEAALNAKDSEEIYEILESKEPIPSKDMKA